MHRDRAFVPVPSRWQAFLPLRQHNDHALVWEWGGSSDAVVRARPLRQGTLQDNSFSDNGRSAFLFDFTRLQVSPQPELSPTFLYLQNSTFRVADLDGELAGFDFDHLLNDPFAGSPVVGNTPVYNGAPQRSGFWVTPLL